MIQNQMRSLRTSNNSRNISVAIKQFFSNSILPFSKMVLVQGTWHFIKARVQRMRMLPKRVVIVPGLASSLCFALIILSSLLSPLFAAIAKWLHSSNN